MVIYYLLLIVLRHNQCLSELLNVENGFRTESSL